MSELAFLHPFMDAILGRCAMMDKMMARAGIDPAVARRVEDGAEFYAARTRCLGCASVRECREWLRCAPPAEVTPEFCPNRAFFRSCEES